MGPVRPNEPPVLEAGWARAPDGHAGPRPVAQQHEGPGLERPAAGPRQRGHEGEEGRDEGDAGARQGRQGVPALPNAAGGWYGFRNAINRFVFGNADRARCNRSFATGRHYLPMAELA